VDGAGAALAVLVLTGITYGLIEGPNQGWSSAAVLVALIGGVVLAPLFIAVERWRRSPMLPLIVFRSKQFSAANAVTFLVYGALSGALFLVPIELQIVDRYSALSSGLALIPITAIMLVFSAKSGQLAGRIGPRLQMAVGPVVIGAGLLLLTRAADPGGYVVAVLPAVLVFGVGLAITVAPLTSTAMAAVSADHAGVASAVNNAVARSAGLFAVAILPFLAGIHGAASLLPSHFGSGFRTAVMIAAGSCAIGGLFAAMTISNGDELRADRPNSSR
jgi:hypothetical protein